MNAVICFDFDSTLCTIEGIDELAVDAGVHDQLAELTNAAMNGQVALEQVYQQRLELVRPSRQKIDWLSERYLATLTEGAGELIKHLKQQSYNIHIISGGLRPAILASADALGIDPENVHAVDLVFSDTDAYQDFDRSSPLARSGGKALICAQLKQPGHPLIMVGDGQTDLEAKHSEAIMIAFTGVVRRENVVKHADYQCHRLAELPKLIDYALYRISPSSD